MSTRASAVTDRWDVARNWWRACDAAVWDRCFAAVMIVLAFVPALGAMSSEVGDLPRRPAAAFAVVLVLAQTVPLAIRRRWPLVCLAIVGVSFAVFQALSYPPEFGTVSLYAALYSVGAHQERWRRMAAIVSTAAFVVFAVILHLLGSPDQVSDFVLFYAMFAVCWVLGAFVRRRRLDEARQRRMAADAAITAERARIARELHDVVTHHVTAMVVQAEALQFLAGSPDRVVAASTAIGGSGRRALTELRCLLDVLEATGESRSVRDLVDQIRIAGQPVELVEDGGQAAVPVSVGLAVYRVVQEGLTNAVKYAAGRPTEVRVRYLVDQVEVEVSNDAATVPLSVGARRERSGGRGLHGLTERVGALGGEVTAGKQPDGRFQLRAMIPVGSAG
ncbi:MAG TPA: histidine kinase [Pseudonocardiaceae bacterium]|jgi:signal transduction histidine kinase